MQKQKNVPYPVPGKVFAVTLPLSEIPSELIDSFRYEQNWTPIAREAGYVVWSTRHLCRHLLRVISLVYTDHEYLPQISKIGKINA